MGSDTNDNEDAPTTVDLAEQVSEIVDEIEDHLKEPPESTTSD